MDKILAVRTILTKGLSWSITLPPFKLQHTGRMSTDGLGCTFQSNVFGHYIMVYTSQFPFAPNISLKCRPVSLPSTYVLRVCKGGGDPRTRHLDELFGSTAVLVRP